MPLARLLAPGGTANTGELIEQGPQQQMKEVVEALSGYGEGFTRNVLVILPLEVVRNEVWS